MLSSEIQIIPASVRLDTLRRVLEILRNKHSAVMMETQRRGSVLLVFNTWNEEQQQANRGSGGNATEENFESFN